MLKIVSELLNNIKKITVNSQPNVSHYQKSTNMKQQAFANYLFSHKLSVPYNLDGNISEFKNTNYKVVHNALFSNIKPCSDSFSNVTFACKLPLIGRMISSGTLLPL